MPTVQEMQQQDDAFVTSAAEARTAKTAQTQLSGSPDGEPAQPSFLSKWVLGPVSRVSSSLVDSAISAADNVYDTPGMRKSRDVVAGAMTGATNMADFVMKHAAAGLASAGDQEDSFAEQAQMQKLGIKQDDLAKVGEPIWDHAKSSLLDFRDAVAVQDPTLADNLTQGVAQLAIPYAGFSRALSGIHAVAQIATAGALTDATALGPHDARMADVLALARHTEGKLGDTLRTLAPDGSAFNAYINYLTDRTNETEAQGRFKNVLDGFGVNLIATPLIHAAAVTLKQGMNGLRYMIDNGVGSSGGMISPGAQRGAVGDLSANGRPPLRQMAGDPAESLYEQQVREDMEKAAANPDGKRPPLQQGVDPAEPLYNEQVKRDMDAAPPEAADAGKNQFADSTLNSQPAIDSFRKVLQSRAGVVGTSSMDVGKPGTAPVADFAKTAGVLIKQLPDDGGEGSFYKDVLQRVVAKNPSATFRVANGPHPDRFAGAYNPTVEDVRLYPDAFQNNGQMVHTFAHEAVHTAVYHDIATNPETESALDTLRKMVKDPIDTHNNAVMMARRNGAPGTGQLKAEHYGTTNVQEFVAEAESNPKFRDAMKAQKTPDGKTVWDKYKETIGGILGLGGAATASPMFDKLLTKEKTGA